MINIVTFPMQSASITSQVSLLFINFHEILRIREQKAIITLLIFFILHKINRVEIPFPEAANAHCQKLDIPSAKGPNCNQQTSMLAKLSPNREKNVRGSSN